MRNWYLVPLPSVLLLLGGCARDPVVGRSFSVRDSAGVRIVESIAPLWVGDAAWYVEATATLDVSEAADETLSRIGAPKLFADGRLVLYNGGPCELRSYDADGRLVASFGRCGEGPGEFNAFRGVWPWRGDSLLVVDQLPNRTTVLGAGGAVGRTARVLGNSDLPLPFLMGVLGDGTLVLTGSHDPAGRSTPGVEASVLVLALADGPDTSPRTIGSFPGAVWEYTDVGGQLRRGQLAFSSSTQFAAAADRIFVGFPDRYEIRALGPRGDLQQIIRRTFKPVDVVQSDVDWLMERRLGEVEGEQSQRLVRQAFRDMRHAQVMPAFGLPVWPGGAEGGPAMLVDDVGNLWVFEHYRPGQYVNRWSVFSAEGAWLGQVTLPEKLVPSQIGPDFVLGRWEDDVGFRHVRRYKLTKP